MDSYPIHTFRWVNAKNEGVYVRYKIVSDAGIKNFTWPEAVQMCGEDPDFAKRDLWQHIDDGGAATWTWYVQTMTDEQAATYYVDPFDATKRWNDKDCPLLQLGKIVINRNPENYHRDVEQAAFFARSIGARHRAVAGSAAAVAPNILQRRTAVPSWGQLPPDSGELSIPIGAVPPAQP